MTDGQKVFFRTVTSETNGFSCRYIKITYCSDYNMCVENAISVFNMFSLLIIPFFLFQPFENF